MRDRRDGFRDFSTVQEFIANQTMSEDATNPSHVFNDCIIKFKKILMDAK